eukprot:scaffold11261_cov73-Phaeocystis_antarctica.AAC.2
MSSSFAPSLPARRSSSPSPSMSPKATARERVRLVVRVAKHNVQGAVAVDVADSHSCRGGGAAGIKSAASAEDARTIIDPELVRAVRDRNDKVKVAIGIHVAESQRGRRCGRRCRWHNGEAGSSTTSLDRIGCCVGPARSRPLGAVPSVTVRVGHGEGACARRYFVRAGVGCDATLDDADSVAAERPRDLARIRAAAYGDLGGHVGTDGSGSSTDEGEAADVEGAQIVQQERVSVFVRVD